MKPTNKSKMNKTILILELLVLVLLSGCDSIDDDCVVCINTTNNNSEYMDYDNKEGLNDRLWVYYNFDYQE